MEYGSESEDDEQDVEDKAARPEAPGPSTGGVRIIGAETAADITSELPVVPPAHIAKDGPTHSSVRIIDEPVVPTVGADEPEAPAAEGAAHAELPHWTEPATGQVPAVLAREDEGDGAGILPPTWREEDADWTAHEEEFEPSMFSDERASLGALDETDDTDEERRPWEFDLDSVQAGQPGPAAVAAAESADLSSDPITEPVEVVARHEPPTGEDAVDREAPTPAAPVETGEATMAVPAVEPTTADAALPVDDLPDVGVAPGPTGSPART